MEVLTAFVITVLFRLSFSKNTRYGHEPLFDNFKCKEADVVFETDFDSPIQCTDLCEKTLNCKGVFHKRSSTPKCHGCKMASDVLDSESGTRFYRPPNCGSVPNAATNGAVVGTDITVGASITYTCDSDYRIETGGVTLATCLADGTWNNAAPECVKDCGSAPNAATNGAVVGTDFTVAASITYTCDTDYRIATGGVTKATCLADGTWNNTAPECVKDCGSAPNAATNGAVLGTDFTVGASVTYTCGTDYRIATGGVVTLATCLADGTWNNAAPECVKDCGSAPNAATNGAVVGTDFTVGASVTYTCGTDYRIATGGVPLATCLADGTWNNAAPECVKDCGSAPNAATNGAVVGTDFTEGASITYTCDTDYRIVTGGVTLATCLADGTWNNAAPECVKEWKVIKTITVDNGTPWGEWKSQENCAKGTYAVGYWMKIEPNLGNGDDSSLNGIRLYCQSLDGVHEGTVTSGVGAWGTWGELTMCPSTTFLTSFALQVEESQGEYADDSAANYVKFHCRDFASKQQETELAKPPGYGYWGTFRWSETCAANTAICGLSTRIESDQGSFSDNSALNDVKMDCCS